MEEIEGGIEGRVDAGSPGGRPSAGKKNMPLGKAVDFKKG
jgi:hypothetical protein